jgi:hypothetical protein
VNSGIGFFCALAIDNHTFPDHFPDKMIQYENQQAEKSARYSVTDDVTG